MLLVKLPVRRRNRLPDKRSNKENNSVEEGEQNNRDEYCRTARRNDSSADDENEGKGNEKGKVMYHHLINPLEGYKLENKVGGRDNSAEKEYQHKCADLNCRLGEIRRKGKEEE